MAQRSSIAESIIAALGGNSSGMCPCPAHDDSTPSLHVSEGAEGKVLVKCHAVWELCEILGDEVDQAAW